MKPQIVLALVALLRSPVGGEANIPVHKPALLHGSVSIFYPPSQKTGTFRIISWRFQNNGKRLTILDTSEKPYHVYISQFTDRLQISDDLLTLSIMTLTLEDSGIYAIDVTDTNGNQKIYSFNVTVYEPIPLPVIWTDVKNTADHCNVTLHCSVPSHASDVSYTWRYRRNNTDYQLYHTGSIIQISLMKSSRDMEFLCTVQNPVQEKNASIQVQEMCRSTEKVSHRRHYTIVIAILVTTTLLLVVASVICIWRMYKRRKEPIETSRNTEMHYIEVTTHPRHGGQLNTEQKQAEEKQCASLNEEQQLHAPFHFRAHSGCFFSAEIVRMENDHNIGMSPPQRTKTETVYSMLQHPPPKNS